jgi:hypothetical protein
MQEKTLQGQVSALGTVVYKTPSGKSSRIISIRTYNSVAYDITLAKFDKSTSTDLDVYSFNLSAGDVMTDTCVYILNEGDYIKLTSSVANTNYFIHLLEL